MNIATRAVTGLIDTNADDQVSRTRMYQGCRRWRAEYDGSFGQNCLVTDSDSPTVYSLLSRGASLSAPPIIDTDKFLCNDESIMRGLLQKHPALIPSSPIAEGRPAYC